MSRFFSGNESLPQNFGDYFNWGTEVVVSRDSQCDEEDEEPHDEEDDSEREEALTEGAVKHGDIVDEAVHIKAVLIVLDKVTPESFIIKCNPVDVIWWL